MEEILWQQKSRIGQLLEGDYNTKFFYLSTKIKRQKNKILSIQDTNEVILEDVATICVETRNYFNSILGSPLHWDHEVKGALSDCIYCLVMNEQNEILLAHLYEDEVKLATFSLGARKSLSPNGFHANLFQKNWDIVSDKIQMAVEECKNRRSIIKSYNLCLLL